jgi:hypothetical protein
MKGTVNPFEPWRPPANRIPPLLHAGRPWRPPSPPPVRAAVEEPPFVEPVKPLPRNKPPERPKQPQRQTGTSSPRPTPIEQWMAFVVLVLGFLCLDSVSWLCGTHILRLMALGASAGIFVGMAFPHPSRGWSTRLIWITAALALAGMSLWFVPTIHGVNLWSAYRQVENLRSLPAGDVAAYQRGAAARRTLVEEFPSFAADVSAAEKAWLRRTVDEAIENADRRLAKDPDAALVRLHQLNNELSEELKRDPSVRKDLTSARRRAVQACLKFAQKP